MAEIAFQNKGRCTLSCSGPPPRRSTPSRRSRHLRAEIGLVAVLHTWGQNLYHHPHVHCLVPGGGPSLDGTRWFACRPGFFLPVRVLSRLFRRLFLNKLRKSKVRDEAWEWRSSPRRSNSARTVFAPRRSTRPQSLSALYSPEFDGHFRADLLGAVRASRAIAFEERPFGTLGIEACVVVGDAANAALEGRASVEQGADADTRRPDGTRSAPLAPLTASPRDRNAPKQLLLCCKPALWFVFPVTARDRPGRACQYPEPRPFYPIVIESRASEKTRPFGVYRMAANPGKDHLRRRAPERLQIDRCMRRR